MPEMFFWTDEFTASAKKTQSLMVPEAAELMRVNDKRDGLESEYNGGEPE